MHLPYTFMALLPLGLEFGDECLNFINSTVCLLSNVPYIVPPMAIVEPIQAMSADQTRGGGCQRSAPWHLGRLLDMKPRNSDYRWDGDGSEIDVYVLDTWVDCDHVDFEDRCRELRRFAEHTHAARPPHGTHVAGLVGSRRHGAAKRANIKSVVVLDDNGNGWYDDFVRALHFVKERISKAGNKRAIVNMSLKGPKSRIMDQLVEELQVNNVAVMVIAAGNDNVDACELSPNSRRVAIVGATNIENVQSQFSNFGRCVSINAPGESIVSLCPDQHECYMSGTSMAAPIVAGAIAAYWDTQPASMNAESVWRKFRDNAERDKLRVRGGTPNLFSHLDAKSRCLLGDDGAFDLWAGLAESGALLLQ